MARTRAAELKQKAEEGDEQAKETLEKQESQRAKQQAPTKRKASFGKKQNDHSGEAGENKDTKEKNGDTEQGERGDDHKRKGDDDKEPEQDGNAQAEAKQDDEEPAVKKQKTWDSSQNGQGGLLDWLLSKEAFDLTNPDIQQGHGEVDWDEEDDSSKKPRSKPPAESGKRDVSSEESSSEMLLYPHSRLTPVQSLLSALLLSKPISHRLGLRTIKTMFNPPFSLRRATDLADAGEEGRRKVLWEARTQHKEKTAVQIGNLVDGLQKLHDGMSIDDERIDRLEGVREKAHTLADGKTEDPRLVADKIKAILTDAVNGVGPTGVDIFLRRVQVDWPEIFPFADARTLGVAAKLGFITNEKASDEPAGAEALRDHLAEHFGLKVDGRGEGKDHLELREQYVRLLDVLIGLEIEKEMDAALQRAGKK